MYISANDLILSKHGSEFRRCIYGLNKGELVDMLDAICSTLPDLYNAIAQGIKSLQHKFKTLSVVSENIDHNTVPAM